ncbi:unnamed protein product [Pneumocystis jirovecii]|uniref:HhH-GPD domain-containing protein n=2 Tax=Pneumocystis jirovecii TaxID=42068 RepID=L0PGG1_PNEJI|nr:uncharacterized protein T551_02532 [Pneumocystis jirovecii RU7]KTW28682.1 hypothetical protein T551_02532 [Pneumocystis jirovecii RU7]CCJ31164.1 unnamed protein product [Pneumocystis jirovecii]
MLHEKSLTSKKRSSEILLKDDKKRHKESIIIQWNTSDSNVFLKPIFSETYLTLLSKALDHLKKVDSRFQVLSERFPCKPFSPEGLMEPVNPFQSLCRAILSQQLSNSASASVYRKFIKLFFPDETKQPQNRENKSSDSQASEAKIFPMPQTVRDMSPENLRLAGCSFKKIEYIKSLANNFLSGDLSAEFFSNTSDEGIMQRLTTIKGIGPWSAEMFLLFSLKRTDILSTGDLGIQRGMALMKGKNISKPNKGKWKYMSYEEMIEMAEPWRPYRSIASWFMWVRAIDI